MKDKVLLLALAALTPAVPHAALAQTQAAQASEDAKLSKLFHDSDEANLKLSPLTALQRGDLRYADSIGDLYSDAADAAEEAQLRAELADLARIDRARLSPTAQIAFDSFKALREVSLRGYAPGVHAIDRALPLDHFTGIQSWYPEYAAANGISPYKTVEDYANALKRNAQYAAQFDHAIRRMRAGMAQGIVLPKLSVRNVIDQLDALIAEGIEGSTFYSPVKAFPESIAAADRARLTAAYAAQVRTVIQPAHQRIRDFLATTYMAAARDSVGLSALPGGDAAYRHTIESITGLPLDPKALHQLGLDELARDTREIEAIMAATGFKGTMPQFFDHLRTEQRFKPASGDQVRAEYAAIAKRVDAHVGEQFSLLPKTGIELRPTPAYTEQRAAPGSYQAGTPDGSRLGVFYYNTYDLPSRYTWQMADLYLHEAVPGHHFQISLARENVALPPFLRFDGSGAFVEGWGLYAEHLGVEMGVLEDPYDRAGQLYGDMIRALRLIVDTGVHAMGWKRDDSIAYMIAHAPVSQTMATSEVDRYIAMPGQAVAYKVGQLTIQKAKDKARAALGARFDPRAFHAQVLNTGALPLPVLESKIDAWIARGGKP